MNYTAIKIEFKHLLSKGKDREALDLIQSEFNQAEVRSTSQTIMDLIEEEAKEVGGIGNVILGGESQGAQETLGTAIHLKDRFNSSIGGIVGLVGPVPLPPNGEQPLLHKSPILLYLGADDHLYDPELCEFGYAYDGLMGPNTEYLVE